MSINVIVAVCSKDGLHGIGAEGKIPWYNKEDMAHFKNTTMGHYVLMGRKTWESIPEKYRPLPGRVNIVVSSNPITKAQTVKNLYDGIQFYLAERKEEEELFICGGEQIYNDFIENYAHRMDKLYLSELSGAYTCDKHFLLEEYMSTTKEHGLIPSVMLKTDKITITKYAR
jgi:dihydrofolate reductase